MVTKDLFGLILVGGESKRMKTDKAFLEFHGEAQYKHAFTLLTNYCEKTFLSLRDASQIDRYDNYPNIIDRNNLNCSGPLKGILSAFEYNPKAAWLVLAVDLPFVNLKTIQVLINERNMKKCATAFRSAQNDLPEPVCAIYEPISFQLMKSFSLNQGACPRKFLINNDVELLDQGNSLWLDNVNSPEEYESALEKLK